MSTSVFKSNEKNAVIKGMTHVERPEIFRKLKFIKAGSVKIKKFKGETKSSQKRKILENELKSWSIECYSTRFFFGLILETSRL